MKPGHKRAKREKCLKIQINRKKGRSARVLRRTHRPISPAGIVSVGGLVGHDIELVAAVAELKAISVEEAARTTTSNFHALFRP